MSRVFAVVVVLTILSLNACILVTDVQEPKQLRNRAETLRAKAAGLRKSAREYEILMGKTRDQIELYETRMEIFEGRRGRLRERLEELRIEKAESSPQEARKLQPTISNYQGELEAVQAKVGEQRSRLNELRSHLEKQRRLKDAFLQKARAREAEARRLEEYAAHQEESS
jgi:chromosome segregation ATPase